MEQYNALFLEESEKDCQAMRVHTEHQEWSSVALLAHRIRGRARIMGFSEFEQACTEVEDTAAAQEGKSLRVALLALDEALAARRNGNS